MTPAQRKNFERLLNPRHIAFVGGTDAAVAVREAERRGFAGEYWPVNPRRTDLGGFRCYTSIDELPQAPDAVFLAIPASAVVEAVAKLAVMGAGGVVCYTAGFKEAGPEGAVAEAALKAAAGDLAVVGPNCYGVINYLGNSALWPFAHGGASPGYGAAIITQSGMFSSDISMSQRSLPLTYMISAGNQAVMAIEDFVDVLCEDPATRAIGIHIEGLLDVAAFERAALKALSLGKPIVGLKTGSSRIGSTLTISHTGTIAGTNELYEALFERTGIISVTNPAQMLETLKYLCVVGAPKDNRVLGFTCSGGGATMLADHGETIGLRFPAFHAAKIVELSGLLPEIATVSNPLDYTTPIWGKPEKTVPVFNAAFKHPEIDAAILIQDYPTPGLDESKIFYQNDAQAFSDAAAAVGIPAAICATLPENLDASTRDFLVSRGVAPMQGIHEALNAIAAAAWWGRSRDRILAEPPEPLSVRSMPEIVSTMTEADGKTLLRGVNFTVPDGICTSAEDAPRAATGLGFPVALKMMGEKLAHKTEAGAVALDLQDAEAVTQAITTMRETVRAHDAGAVTERFLVECMAPPPLAELIVGIRRDPQFGFAMTLGSGGVLVELVGDASTLLLPANKGEVMRALLGLKVMRLLNGFRGKPAADVDALASALLNLSRYVLATPDPLVEIEINPLFVYSDRVLAVDVLIRAALAP